MVRGSIIEKKNEWTLERDEEVNYKGIWGDHLRKRQEESRGSEAEHTWSVKGTSGGQGGWHVVCKQQEMSQRHRGSCQSSKDVGCCKVVRHPASWLFLISHICSCCVIHNFPISEDWLLIWSKILLFLQGWDIQITFLIPLKFHFWVWNFCINFSSPFKHLIFGFPTLGKLLHCVFIRYTPNILFDATVILKKELRHGALVWTEWGCR